jgi:hypothetical protein
MQWGLLKLINDGNYSMSKELAQSNKKLAAYEKQIDKNIKAAWYENNIILVKIRDEGLYVEKYGTFENYLNDRWGHDKSTGYRLIGSVELCQKLELQMSPIGDKKAPLSVSVLPENESQVRPLLTGLKTDSERAKVWDEVVEQSKNEGRKITAAYVQQKVDEFVASGEVAEEIDFEELKRQQDETIAAKKLATKKPELVIDGEVITREQFQHVTGRRLTGDLGQDEFLYKDALVPRPAEDPFDVLQETIEMLETDNSALQTEIESMAKVFESNDQLTTALAEVKKFQELARVLKESLNGAMNSENAAKRQAKMWRDKYQKLAKEVGRE